MIPLLPERKIALRRRPDDESFEDVCTVINFMYNNHYNSSLQTPQAVSSQLILLNVHRGENASKRRPINEDYETMCKLICFEDPNDFVFESESESESVSDSSAPSTPTNKPTVPVSTNAPERPKRF